MERKLPWLMAGLTFMFLGFLMTGLNSSAVLFVVPITEELNMSRGLYSGSFFLLAIVQLIVATFYGLISQKLKVRYVILITAIMAVLSCIVSALAQNAAFIYLGATLRGAALGLGMVPIAASIISNWFDKHKGIMMGAVFSASGFGGLLLMYLFTSWVNSPDIGWRLAYYYISVIIGIPMIIAFLFIKGSPEEAGTKPYGASSDTEKNQNPSTNNSLTFKQASNTSVFYICILIIFLICSTFHGTFLHFGSFFSDMKINVSTLGIGLSLFSVGIMVGQMLYGYIHDNFGIGYIFPIAAIFYTIAITISLTFYIDALIILSFTILGFAVGINLVSVGLLTSIFGKKHYSKIIGVFSAIMALGMAIGPYVLGLAYDIHHTYKYIFIVYMCFALGAGTLGFVLQAQIKNLNKLKEELNST